MTCVSSGTNPPPNTPSCSLPSNLGYPAIMVKSFMNSSGQAATFSIDVKNIVNPTSTQPAGTINIYSFDSNSILLDQCLGLTVTVIWENDSQSAL